MAMPSSRYCLKVLFLMKNEGLKPKDIKAAEMVLEENKELAIEKWNDYFGRNVTNEDF